MTTRLIRLVLSDLHLADGARKGEINPFEPFYYEAEFGDLLRHYDELAGTRTEIELIFNGDIFDLLKVKINNVWPREITEEVATAKVRKCLDGHPDFVLSLREFLAKPGRRLVYLPGNHDLDMWFKTSQELFCRYVAPGALGERVRFITANDTYYLPEGIQIRHGHQFEPIHRVNYAQMTRRQRDGVEVLELPWGSLWILEVMNPAKQKRAYVDHIQPFHRFILMSMILDTRFAFAFLGRSLAYFLKYRVFTIQAWRKRWADLMDFPRRFKEEILSLEGYDEAAVRSLRKLRGVHTLIVGHSHLPGYRSLPDGKLLVNTGTWIRMINLDLEHLGQRSGLTYALIDYNDEGKPMTTLMRWRPSARTAPFVHYPD